MEISTIIACAGNGSRTGFTKNKLLMPLNDKTVFENTFLAFYNCDFINNIIIVCKETEKQEFISLCNKHVENDNKHARVTFVSGGDTRTQSVKNALDITPNGIVLIHDGARPFISTRLIKDCIMGAEDFGGVIPVIPSHDTTVKISEGEVQQYLGKSRIYCVQTPQAFQVEQIKKAYDFAGDQVFNDDGEVYKNCFGKVYTIDGDIQNSKLTFKEDFEFTKSNRVGTGFDCHKLVENRKLILGGIEISHHKGLLGHSDADVVVHAIMDAMLSACSLRDIGYYFPDTDPKYKDADSMKLLDQVVSLCKNQGYKVENLSVCIMAEKPKLKEYIPKIICSLKTALNISENSVGVSATTLEGLGFVGREEGICCSASVLLCKCN